MFVCRISSNNLMGLLLTKYSGQVAEVMERIGAILEAVAGHLPGLAERGFCDGADGSDAIEAANPIDQGAGPNPGRGSGRSTGQSAMRSVTTNCSRPQLKYYFGEAVRVLGPLPAPVWRILVIADDRCSIHGLVTKNAKGYAFTPDFGLFVRPKRPIEFSSVEQITEKLLAR